MASTIDRSIPATNADLVSADVRGNFNAAADDHEGLEASKLDTSHATDPSAHGGAQTHVGRTDNPHGVTAAQAGADPAGTASSEVNSHNLSGAAHGGVEAAFSAHDGAGGAAHANVVAAGAAGFMTGSDKSKLDGVDAGANNYSHPNHTGDVTSVGDGAQTIANNAVSNAKAADVPANTIKGRATTTGDPTDIDIEALADGGTPAASDVVLGKKAAGDLVKFLGSNLGGGGSLPDISQYSMYARLSAGIGPGEEMVINSLTSVASPAGSESVLAMLGTGELRRILVSNFPTGGGGEVNVSTTPATVGANQADINMSKVGSDLQKRAIYGSTSIGVAQNAQDISLSAIPGGINHDALLNFDGDEHVAHSGVTITAGAGLAGGGTIAATRTLDVGAGDGISVAADAVAVDATVARRNAANTFTGNVDTSGSATVNEQSVNLHQPATNTITTSTTISLAAGDSPRNFCNVATTITITAPSSGDGIASLHLGPLADNVSFAGFTRIMGTARAAGKAADAKIERFADGTTTLAWGAQEA